MLVDCGPVDDDAEGEAFGWADADLFVSLDLDGFLRGATELTVVFPLNTRKD